MNIKEAKGNVKKLLENANPFTMQPYIYFSIETVLNELEKKDKIINELVMHLIEIDDINIKILVCDDCPHQECHNYEGKITNRCIIEYFTKKVEGK